MALFLGLLIMVGSFAPGISDLVSFYTCSMDGIVVSFSASEMALQGYQTFSLTNDQDAQCRGYADGSEFKVSVTGPAFLRGACGLHFNSLNGRHTVSATVHLVGSTPEASVDQPISCTFTMNALGNVESEGTKPRAAMSVFTDSNYSIPEHGQLALGKQVYVKVELSGSKDDNIVLVMENCYATTSASADNSNRVSLLQSGDSVPGPLATEVLENEISNQGKFSFKMFKFRPQPGDLYLHCDVYICVQSSGHCHQTKRRRRSSPEKYKDMHMTVSQGPFSYYKE